MADPMDVVGKRSYTRTPGHLKKFARVRGCGPDKMRSLMAAFPSEDDLERATQDDFRKLPKVGRPVADRLFSIKDIPEDQIVHNGVQRVPVWNKVRRKKVSGGAAPKASELDAWLTLHADTHERYTGQDEAIKSPDAVPEPCQMAEVNFEAHWISETKMDTLEEALGRVPMAAGPYGLRPLTPRPAEAVGGGAMAAGPSPGTLHFALLQGSASIDGDVDSLHIVLQQTTATSQLLPLPMLQAARETLKRPVWVWTCAQPASVFLCDDQEDSDPTQVTPIRICQIGGWFFALVPTENTDEVVVTLTPVAAASSAADPTSVDHAELPDLKDDVDRGLADVQSQMEAISGWSETHLKESYNLSAAKKEVSELRERLASGSGTYAAFLGDNGVGKSTICNLLILNSSIDEVAYKTRRDDYVPEALLDLGGREVPQLYTKLLADPGDVKDRNLVVTLLSSSAEDAASAAAQYTQLEKEIKTYCEGGGNKPQLKRYVLPCGEGGGSTTSLHTRVRFGTVVHLLVEHYSIEELKKEAFGFVTLYRGLNGEDPSRIQDRQEKKTFMEKWYVYLNIKSGPYQRKDLPRISQLPDADDLENSWRDIVLCDNLLNIVSSPKHLYLGGGQSLHLDRVMVHDLVKKMNDKEQLYRYAVKSLEIYQPAAVLEGGNGFVDLPGQNDVDTGCAAQTREGVKEAGVVFIVLKKSLYEDEASLELLRETDTIKRAALGEANVVFMFNREPQSEYKFRELETEYEVNVRAELEKNTRECWETALLEANDELKREGRPEEAKTDDEIRQIAADTPMRTIYPMIHSSYKLNWECSEQHKAGDTKDGRQLSSSTSVFNLSNVHWLLGILETLNRQGLVDQLKHIATVELPALKEKLQTSLADAKNAQGGLPTDLVDKAAKMLTSKRKLDGAIGIASQQLIESINALGRLTSSSSSAPPQLGLQRSMSAGAPAATDSFRLQLDELVSTFVDESDEIGQYLQRGRDLSDERWAKMSKQMRRYATAASAVDPKNKGTLATCCLLPMIFGTNSRHVPFSFEPLVTEIAAKLEAMLEKVIDLVIERVDLLITSGSAQTAAASASASTAASQGSLVSLKESFVASDVIQPLMSRFSLQNFVKTRQRDPMLNDGKLNEYLKKYAATVGFAALKNKILSRGTEQPNAESIRKLIGDNREAVRIEWKALLGSGIRDFVGEQFVNLVTDLTYHTKKTAAYSVKGMLAAFLKHIVNTDSLQRNEGLQQDLSGFIKDLAYKTNSLRSLWARLDGEYDPVKLGVASARHMERRRQREQTQKRATVDFKLWKPNQTMPVADLDHADLEKSHLFTLKTNSDLFLTSQLDQISEMKAMLRTKYKLDVFQRSGTENDLFCAVALVAYKSSRLKEKACDPVDPSREHTINEHVAFAASQLRAVAAAQLAHHYRTDERALALKGTLGEVITDYIERVNTVYRGDLLCLWALATHFQRAFRVWIPGTGSIHIPPTTSSAALRSKVAFQLMLSAEAPGDTPLAEHYRPTWFPVQLLRSTTRVSFAATAEIRDLPMTDDDRQARVTSDPETRNQLGIQPGFAQGPLRRTPPAYSSRKRPLGP